MGKYSGYDLKPQFWWGLFLALSLGIPQEISAKELSRSAAVLKQSPLGEERTKRSDGFSFLRIESGEAIYRHEASGAIIRIPKAYKRTAVKSNQDIQYGFAFRHREEGIEVRIHYQPGNTNQSMCRAWAKTMQLNLNSQAEPRMAGLGPGFLTKMNADWATLSVGFKLDPALDFNEGFTIGQVVVLCKGSAGMYTIINLWSDDGLFKRFLDAKRAEETVWAIQFP